MDLAVKKVTICSLRVHRKHILYQMIQELRDKFLEVLPKQFQIKEWERRNKLDEEKPPCFSSTDQIPAVAQREKVGWKQRDQHPAFQWTALRNTYSQANSDGWSSQVETEYDADSDR